MIDPETGNAIWVISDRTHDDHYLPVIQVGPDTAIPLTEERGVTYVRAVYAAAAQAEYDAAIIAQFTKIGIPVTAAAEAVADLRADRPQVHTGTRLAFTPIVKSRDRRPAVHVLLDGQRFCEWEPANARLHGGHVLDALAVVPLDAALLAFCVGPLGMPVDAARAIVADLANHRQTEE